MLLSSDFVFVFVSALILGRFGELALDVRANVTLPRHLHDLAAFGAADRLHRRVYLFARTRAPDAHITLDSFPLASSQF
jgi:hypothetical protein